MNWRTGKEDTRQCLVSSHCGHLSVDPTSIAAAGDLLMVNVLRRPSEFGIAKEFPNLAAYVGRGEARHAFKRAFADQLAVFEGRQPNISA